MTIAIGSMIEHGGEKFVVVDIKHQVTADGAVLYLTGFDPEMAKQERQKSINMEQTQHQIVEMLKKMTGEGGPLGGIGFGIGG
jgi:hypothetical protein